MYDSVLEKSGLKKGEAVIYDLLIRQGEMPANKIVSDTTYKRGMVYKHLEDLEHKGLVTTTTKNKKTYFRAEHPQRLLEEIEYKLQEAQMQKISMEAVLPKMSEEYVLQETRPAVIHQEGIEGIKRVFNDIYAPKEEPVYGCVDLEKSDKAVPGHVVKKLIPLRIKNKVFAKTFLADSPSAQKVKAKDTESLRESVLLDKKKYPLPAEIDVYEDKVALLSFDKEAFSGVLIENKDIATSLKTIFKLAFEYLQEKENAEIQGN